MRAPKRGRLDLGRKTYIQQIIEKAKTETSSHAAIRPGAKRVRSEGQSIDQPVHTPVSIGDLVQQGPPLAEGSSSIGPD